MAKDSTFNLRIVINGEKVKNTLHDVKYAVARLAKEVHKMEKTDPEFKAKVAELKRAKGVYHDMRDEINGTNISLQEAKGHWNDLFDGVLSGDFDSVSSGLKGITGNIKGMAKAAWAFIATPIGAAIAVLSGIAVATKEWANYNEEAAKANLTVSSITGVVGSELDVVRVKAQALTEIFGKSTFEENIKTAKSLVKNFGITYKEAFDLIEDSYVRGATANDEFNDSIVEFSAIQKKAGFTAKETVALINTAYSEDLYKDKFIDAIHEVDTAITEQSKSAKEALTGAFGDKFTSSLFKKVKTGAISTKDAIALISKQASTASLDQQQYAKLTADIFKSAGEDIGGAKKVLEVFNKALNEQAKALTPVQLETKRLSDAHLELKQAQDEALKSDDYAKFSNDVTIIWAKTKTFFYKSVGAVVGYFQDWFLKQKLGFSDMMVSFKAIPMRFDETKKILITAVGNILDAFKHLGNAWESLKNLDLKGVRAEVGNFNSSIKDAATGASDAYDKIGKKIDEVRKKARNKIIKEHFDSKTGAGEIQEKKEKAIETSNTPKKNTITQQDLDKEKKLLKERNEIFAKSAEKKAALLEKQKEDELAFRDSVLLSSKTVIEKEVAAYEDRLKKAGLFGKDKNKLTELDLLIKEKLEAQHQVKVAKIETEAINDFLAKKAKSYESEKIKRQTSFNNEIASVTDLAKAKSLLSETFSNEELDKIDSIETAKNGLKRQHESLELQKQAAYFQDLINLYTTALNTGEIEGVNFADNILTEEQKEALNEKLEEVRLKLSDVNIAKSGLKGGGNEDAEDDSANSNDFDFFGMTPDQWDKSFENLDTAKGQIEAVGAVLNGLQDAWGMYNQSLEANEKKQLQTLEKSTNEKKKALKKSEEEKKKALKKQLDDGLIDEEKYNKQIQSLKEKSNKEIESLDAELEKKQAEIEYKKAKRERTSALFSIAVSTGIGIAKAAAASPLTGGLPWTALIGAMGVAQAAFVMSKPLPNKGHFVGGHTGDKALYHDGQDGVTGPVHVGEWVAPKWMNDNPRYAPTIQYLENERIKGPGYFDGGHVAPPTSSGVSDYEETDEPETFEDNNSPMLLEQLTRLNNHLDNGIISYALIGDEEIQELKIRTKKINNSRENAKIQ
ncbi:hypothetical protein LNJ06_09400 [Tenacibaculum finnmarkense genomovar ulcerans]|uniref:hypothetical protein n=1 Tax=Tenacibaculum finnmarkense TaxID=2781243 RepID=UPI001E4CCA0C|nr:hypothetical protein [Tenacibaculum finnmarkense]MCD8430382.1 hypothetical protein [Tenacibaculum finnmarkense genomovar ulcerans]